MGILGAFTRTKIIVQPGKPLDEGNQQVKIQKVKATRKNSAQWVEFANFITNIVVSFFAETAKVLVLPFLLFAASGTGNLEKLEKTITDLNGAGDKVADFLFGVPKEHNPCKPVKFHTQVT